MIGYPLIKLVRPAKTDYHLLLSTQPLTIGRSLTNDLVVEDRTVSREHARLFHFDGTWHIIDD